MFVNIHKYGCFFPFPNMGKILEQSTLCTLWLSVGETKGEKRRLEERKGEEPRGEERCGGGD